MRRLWLGSRSFLFYCFYVILTTVFSLLCVSFIFLLPYKHRAKIILMWNRCVILSLKYICGINYRVHGLENIPSSPYVALAKHQSAWETFFLADRLQPIVAILKQELLRIPGFGWGLALLKPIPIDRNNPRAALKAIRTIGKQRLNEENLPVLVFPEGTRTAPGAKGNFARSGASLAIESGVPVIFIAHNAGYFWPVSHMTKYPGTIDVFISEPVDTTGRTPADLTKQAEEWIEAHINVPEPPFSHFK